MKALVTGGAGFIGSSLVDNLIRDGHDVRILDDLSTGFVENISGEAEFVRGAITDLELARKAVDGVEVVFHQAAHKAVLRSVEQPLATDSANTHGTLTILKAAADCGVRRVVYASSSSVYGGAAPRPTRESSPLLPRSPYAVTKLAGEHYCRVFTELYGLETVALRYFNVYGPRQRPDSQYAAVVPLFIDALRRGDAPVVHGDGLQTRDFTYVDDAVTANRAAAIAPADACSGRAYNIAGGLERSLLDLLSVLSKVLDAKADPIHVAPRPGDVRHSCADVSAAERDLGHIAKVTFEEGMRLTAQWFVKR